MGSLALGRCTQCGRAPAYGRTANGRPACASCSSEAPPRRVARIAGFSAIALGALVTIFGSISMHTASVAFTMLGIGALIVGVVLVSPIRTSA